MPDTTIDFNTVVKWSEPKRVVARGEEKDLLHAEPTDEFSALWKNPEAKKALKEAGITWSKRPDGWKVVWWRPISQAEQEKAAENIERSRATDADIEIPANDGLAYLGYQKGGIQYALEHEGCYIGDEMGLGKTIQAIGVINADPSIKTALIFCPASLKINWVRELQKWLTRPFKIGRAKGKLWPDGADIVVINYDIAKKHHKFLTAKEWDICILDEAHYCKNAKAQRTKCIVGHKARKLSERVEGIRARRKVAMSGTPILNRPIELWTMIQWLKPGCMGSWKNYAFRYCDAKNNGFGWDVSGSCREEELQRNLRNHFMVRRLKSEVLTDLPAKRRQVIELPVDSTVRKAVKAEMDEWEVRKDALVKIESRIEMARLSDDLDGYTEAVQELKEAMQLQFESMSKVRHETGVRKCKVVIEYVKNALESGEKIILFAHHLDVIEELRRELADAQPAVVIGGMDDEKKMAEVDRFQEDDRCRLFIGGIKAANAGLTLTAASTVIFAEMDWTPGIMQQCEDRAHRIGQTNSVLVQFLVLEGSVDARIAATNVRKMDIIGRALDDKTADAMPPVIGISDSIVISSEELEKAVGKERKARTHTMPPEQVEAIHLGLRRLAGVCNGASTEDDMGFSKVDVEIGHDLANCPRLSPKQAAFGAKLCNKYRRQLGPELVAAATGKEIEA